MITKDSFDLLQKMKLIEIEKFVKSKNGEPPIGVIVNITKCFDKILSFVTTNIDAVHTVTNQENSMTIVINNTDKKTSDHLNHFVISIHETCQTFQVEQILSPYSKTTKTLILRFDEPSITKGNFRVF